MLNKLSRYLVVVFMALVLSACVLIPKPHEIPWVHRVNLHADPRPDDFAVLVHESNDYDHTWRVEKVEGERLEISLRVAVHVMMVDLDFQQHFIVDREGQVLDAWIRYDNGEIKTRPVAARGQPGGYQHFEPLAVSPGHRITTQAGEFAIHAAQRYAIVTDLGLGKSKGQNVEYLSDDVPFRTVKVFNQGSFDSGVLLNLMQTVALAGSASLNGNAARVFERTLDENSDSFDKIELKSFGRGKI